MPSPAWENLDDFLSVDDFATSVLVRLQDGSERVISAIFDDPYLNAQLGEYEMDTSRPRVTCKESDVMGVQRGDVVVLNGKTYDVRSAPQSDGVGVAMLELAPQ